MSACVCVLVAVLSEPPGQVQKDGFVFGSRCTSPSPVPTILPCSITPPQEAYGESDWRDLGPTGSALLPSSSVLDEALWDTQAPPRSLLTGNKAEEAAPLSG